MEKNNPKIIRAWTLYDWANSAYNLTITAAIFPIFFDSVTRNEHSDMIQFMGLNYKNTALYDYTLALAFFIIAIISPILGGVADYLGNRKSFLKFFATLGAVSCMGLYFFDSHNLSWGLLCMLFACIGWSGANVFYNAYLPEITDDQNADKVSARGYALGYFGSLLLLIANLLTITFHQEIGITKTTASQISFLSVGIWWISFAQIPFKILPNNPARGKISKKILINGYTELSKVQKKLKTEHGPARFLTAFFLYNMALQTVMYVAATFGSKEIKMESSNLILTILIIQVVGILGSFLFSALSKKFGNVKALSIGVSIWVFICIFAYFVQEKEFGKFYALAGMVGLVMGGVQALSRATYAKLLPANTDDITSYFSFYDVTEKLSIVFGMLSYGFLEEFTGSMKGSIIALGIYFLLGLFLLQRLRPFLKSK